MVQVLLTDWLRSSVGLFQHVLVYMGGLHLVHPSPVYPRCWHFETLLLPKMVSLSFKFSLIVITWLTLTRDFLPQEYCGVPAGYGDCDPLLPACVWWAQAHDKLPVPWAQGGDVTVTWVIWCHSYLNKLTCCWRFWSRARSCLDSSTPWSGGRG